jgi:glucitol operon activator protein
MAIWQWALLALGLVWAFQAVGVWMQMRHYSDVFKGITSKYNDGFVGAGHARGRLRKGAIAMVVVGQDLVVKRVLTMTGRSIFAKFQRNQQFEELTLSELKAAQKSGSKDARDIAIVRAIEQVEKIQSRKGAQPADPDFAVSGEFRGEVRSVNGV